MPSTVVLEKKKAQVAELSDRIKNSCAGVIVDYKGINVADDTALRKELREAGVNYTVIKNSILARAAENLGLNLDASVIEGTSAIATSDDDYVAAARILNKYAEGHDNFNIKTGYLDGEIIDNAKIVSLAKLPSREVLLATVCSAFNAPIAAFARAVQAIVDKGDEAPVEEKAEEAPAEAPAEEAAPVEEAPKAQEAPAEEVKAEAPAEEAAE
ncbi:MAG: 50S ribosomal protein L10 [Eubacterium sp.]|nr:50S ribosomal protein L10 [Eubacterium sp.]